MAKDLHMDALDLLKMVQLEPNSIGSQAVVPGPLERVSAVTKRLADPVREFSFAGTELYTGSHTEHTIAVINSGQYAPPAAIATEILCAAGVKDLIRIGSCGAMRADIAVGDLIVITGAIRGDGTTKSYVEDSFSTVADVEVTTALLRAGAELGYRCHKGLIWTTDALLRETHSLIERMRRMQAIAVDMVSSPLLTIAQLNGVRAGCICAVSDNLVTGELGFGSPRFFAAETRTIDVALRALQHLRIAP